MKDPAIKRFLESGGFGLELGDNSNLDLVCLTKLEKYSLYLQDSIFENPKGASEITGPNNPVISFEFKAYNEGSAPI